VENKRLEILGRLQAGEIDAEQAAELLRMLRLSEEAPEGETIDIAQPPAGLPEVRWSGFWLYPLAVGAAVLLLGALVLSLVFVAGVAAGWLICGWPLAILGFVVVLLALWSRRARWLHLRVKEAKGSKVAISFPLPLTLAAWVLRIAQPFIPQLKDTGVDDLIIALRSSPRDQPFSVQVDEGDRGDKVDIYIG
jgi:hypothetical protein